jgi:GGDEF domain-containing protein
MVAIPLDRTGTDDPRRLRDLLDRARSLAEQHALHSVLVGMAGFEGDPVFAEVVHFVESALRVDDGIFRMTGDRVVLLLADVDRNKAQVVMERLLEDYRENFPTNNSPAVGLGYFEVAPELREVSLKQVLPAIFAEPPVAH